MIIYRFVPEVTSFEWHTCSCNSSKISFRFDVLEIAEHTNHMAPLSAPLTHASLNAERRKVKIFSHFYMCGRECLEIETTFDDSHDTLNNYDVRQDASEETFSV